MRVADIDWIEAADYYVRLHAGKQSYLARQTMAETEAMLDPEKFARVHRAAIVNLERVAELAEDEVLLRDGTHIRMSRRGRARVSPHLSSQWP